MGRKLNLSLESLLVMALVTVFMTAAVVLIWEGRESYDRIMEVRLAQDKARTALSYLAGKVRQNDGEGLLRFQKEGMGDTGSLVLIHGGAEEGYATHIFFEEGILWECYTEVEGTPDRESSQKVISLPGLVLEQEPKAPGLLKAWVTDGMEPYGLPRYMAVRGADLQGGAAYGSIR
ncbi:DUF4860 domain-containing protein [Anaerotalea alkaliphila]|uniref:DUF4860 domain-containing protein n=1 Tax=Anaerotalea alkaliphila TaxID=2662126 RepID=A0A7X5HT46_9FIRM|nr:DUF4860 domain-containing protein [Anaerotalea alkaliphila]NDL66171.1 DUF4860 domain-containing protein [Anaerotalea alkaliphila]